MSERSVWRWRETNYWRAKISRFAPSLQKWSVGANPIKTSPIRAFFPTAIWLKCSWVELVSPQIYDFVYFVWKISMSCMVARLWVTPKIELWTLNNKLERVQQGKCHSCGERFEKKRGTREAMCDWNDDNENLFNHFVADFNLATMSVDWIVFLGIEKNFLLEENSFKGNYYFRFKSCHSDA